MHKQPLTIAVLLLASMVSSKATFAQLNPNTGGQGLSLPAVGSAVTAASAPAVTSAGDRKRELANQLVLAQRGPEMNRLANELAQTAVSPAVEPHMQRISRLPKAQSERAMQQLEALAGKFSEDVAAEVRNKLTRFDSEVLIPEYMEQFSEEELGQLVAFFNSEAVRKYQGLSPRLGEKLVKRVIDEARPRVERLRKDFDSQAQRINGASAASPSRPASAAR